MEIFAWARWQKQTHADNTRRRFKGMWTSTAGLLTPWELSGTWPIVATVLRATSSLGFCQGFPLILILFIMFWASHNSESPIYFLQMMWFFWCHLVVICSSHWHRWAECRAAGMRISFSSVYSRSRTSSRTNQFKHLRKLFMNEGREERETERCRSDVVKSKLIVKAKLLIYQSIYIPTLTNSHKLWTET